MRSTTGSTTRTTRHPESHGTRADDRQTVVVIGNGMVGHRFCERLVERDVERRYRIVTFCEEPRPAYDRVGLTKFFEHRDAERMLLARLEWYEERDIEIRLGDRAASIDREARVVRSAEGHEIAYDRLVLATGSAPFVPPVPGIDKQGVFVYRTIEDLESIIEFGARARTAAVIGGGLLGLEAAKATFDLGLETHVVEFAPRLMPRQVDDAGSRLLVRKIEELGVRVHLSKATNEVIGNGTVDAMAFADGDRLDVDMIVVSAGIRPRDELAKECGLAVGERGGIVVDDELRTSEPDIYAIGEVALHRGMIYGLVAPGYDMADVLAENLCGGARRFAGGDLSTKLKLMGVDVASFGDYAADPQHSRELTFEDPFAGVYRKLVFSLDGKRLLGGILVGDASDFATLAALARGGEALDIAPGDLLVSSRAGATSSTPSLPVTAHVCSCNNVTKESLCSAIRDVGLCTVADVKSCTRAGTGCGGCLPLVTSILNAELEASGKSVEKALCEHFPHTRQELFEIVKIKGIRSFDEILAQHGTGNGCEVCKPAVASILASLWNENILEHATLQDTNDRFLANMQRGGLYSVIPRVPGGEITPEQLVALGEVARKYDLYTKITGAQRVDLFGARVHQLPDIWEELIAVGFESGHAYGKALRTVKSCVGTTWCRYGVQDSVGFAIRVEKRYRGLRAPHKLKSAVSGCMRECAEAQSKDFGLIATETGYNLYVCGNGGAKPRHGDLLASDLDEDTCIRFIDRFLMYYIKTADKLTRTSVWLESLPGGIAHLRDVVIDDSLGLCDELERMMQHHVDTYRCEWAEVVSDPEKRKRFRQFVNTDETETGIEIVTERGQHRPADWPRNGAPVTEIALPSGDAIRLDTPASRMRWVEVGVPADFPPDGAACIKYGKTQIAVYNFASRGEWYATQNMCPHRNAFVLSRGILGDVSGEPKIACPLHKKPYSLRTGESLSGEPFALEVFPVRVRDGVVELELPPKRELDERLATAAHCVRGCAGAGATTA